MLYALAFTQGRHQMRFMVIWVITHQHYNTENTILMVNNKQKNILSRRNTLVAL